MKHARSRPEGCLSDFALDRRLGAELEGEERAAADAHVAECTRCAARAAALEADRAAFAVEGPALQVPAAAPALRLADESPRGGSLASRQRRGMLAGRALGALALAAAVIVFLAFRGPRSGRGTGAGDDPGSTRIKGGEAALGFYVNHRGSVRVGGPRERVAPGDGLRFSVHGGADHYFSVLSIDGARHASIYYPSRADAAERLPGTNLDLPQSTTLDETLGDETIYGIFCDKPYAPESFRRVLETNPDLRPSAEGCVVDTLHIRKEIDAPP